MVRRTILISIVLLTISSCRIVKTLSALKKENATVHSYALAEKEIKFIGMHHLGKQEFYDDVKARIHEYKNEGYTVYYELITTKLQVDSVEKDMILRKRRKIFGTGKSYEEQAKGTFLEKYVRQPSYEELGTDESDIRADVDYQQFIDQWEKINGEIVLDSTDLHTPFGAEYEKGAFYSRKQYNKIVIDYRNQYLLDLIQASESNKILVIYGEGHRKDFERKLKDHNTGKFQQAATSAHPQAEWRASNLGSRCALQLEAM